MPVVSSFGTIGEMVRNGEFIEEGVDLKVFFSETSGAVASIAGENQTG